MSKQLKKLSYEPETITIDVSSATPTDSGTLTISQIKVLLEDAKNTITYQTSANYSEVLHLAQADYENSTAPKATYTADYYDSSTNVYYKHIIVVSYNTLFNSATWVFVSAPMVSGSSSDLQEKLVSGTNIKTINGNSVLGSGNLAISEFPDPSQVDATLVQIAGVNSGGSPDVGKVAAGNISSTGATSGQVLTADGSGGASWAAASSGGMTNPMTTANDIIIGGTSGTPTRLAKGTNNYVLMSKSTGIAWEDVSAGLTPYGQGAPEIVEVAGFDSNMGYTSNQVGHAAISDLPYLTTAPTAANTSGLKIVVLSSEPAQKFDGYIYFITGSNS